MFTLVFNFFRSLDCRLIVHFFRMIQTRGRARKPGSRYIILADEAQHAMQDRIKNQEQLLDFVIGPTKYGPSQKVTFQSLFLTS